MEHTRRERETERERERVCGKKELSHTCSLVITGKPSPQHQVHVEFCYAELAFGP